MTEEGGSVRTAVDHVGLTVTDLDAAIEWYRAVFGLEILQGPDVIGGGEDRVRDIFGPNVADFRIAYLGSPTGTRLQLFEFTDPPVERRSESFDYWRTGISHVGLACADVADAVARLEAHGGRRRSSIHGAPPGLVYCYCEDPDGNVIELIAPRV
jgi:catechol 2,3-dioxygenase-like lactoylglutathione lyase family enzyme